MKILQPKIVGISKEDQVCLLINSWKYILVLYDYYNKINVFRREFLRLWSLFAQDKEIDFLVNRDEKSRFQQRK